MSEWKSWEIKDNVAHLKSDSKLKRACKEAIWLLKKEIDIYLQVSKRNVVEAWYDDKCIKGYLTKVGGNMKVVINLTEEELFKNIAESLSFITGIKVEYEVEEKQEVKNIEIPWLE